ncbi:MAG: membrane protein insertase YidC [Bacteroidetes bacterium B1(2017)]|nr:MAG: membrane protein insertase YidC [Bacteroidetes bacterium B1(2017)]
MDRNSIIGLGLIFVILISFAYLNQPSQAEIDAAKRRQDSLTLVRIQNDSIAATMAMAEKKVAEAAIPTQADSAAKQNAFGTFASYTEGKEQMTTIENEELKVDVTNKGGRIFKVELKKYKRADGSPLVLVDGVDNEFSYGFATRDAKAISTKDLYFTPALAADGKSVTMKVNLADGQYIEHKVSFNASTNLVDFKINLVGMESLIAPNYNILDLSWKQNILQQEKTHDAEEKTSTIYYRYPNEDAEFLAETKDVKEDLKTPIQWISFKQQYFNTALISAKTFDKALVETKLDQGKKFVKFASANIELPYNHSKNEEFSMQFYFGPNHYKTLKALNIGLEKVVPMGWGIFGWVNKLLTVNVFYFLGQYLGNFGIVILLLTVIVKTLLFPLVYRSYLSSAKMRVLKPEIDEIKEKYGNDMAKLQQENMKIYRKAGVNPMGGCLPMLLQMPILIAMFQFFPSAFELRQKAFLWSSDLSSYDSILNFGFNIPFYGDHVSLFTLLMTVSTLVYTMYNNQMTGVTGQMKVISYLMPVMFLGFFNNYASGLTYYYFLSNLFTIGQQLLIRQFVDDKALHKQIQENKKKPVTKSRLQSKLEDMAKKRGFDPDKLSK